MLSQCRATLIRSRHVPHPKAIVGRNLLKIHMFWTQSRLPDSPQHPSWRCDKQFPKHWSFLRELKSHKTYELSRRVHNFSNEFINKLSCRWKPKKIQCQPHNRTLQFNESIKNPILLLARLEIAESARVKAVNLRKIPAQLGKARLTYFTFHLHWVNVT